MIMMIMIMIMIMIVTLSHSQRDDHDDHPNDHAFQQSTFHSPFLTPTTATGPTLSHSGHTLQPLHLIHELPNSCRTSANTPSDRAYQFHGSLAIGGACCVCLPSQDCGSFIGDATGRPRPAADSFARSCSRSPWWWLVTVLSHINYQYITLLLFGRRCFILLRARTNSTFHSYVFDYNSEMFRPSRQRTRTVSIVVVIVFPIALPLPSRSTPPFDHLLPRSRTRHLTPSSPAPEQRTSPLHRRQSASRVRPSQR